MRHNSITEILHQTREIYNFIAPDFSDTRSKWWRGFGDFNKYVKPGDKVLDLGCGNGRLAEIFLDSKVEYLGIDNSVNLLKIAEKRFKNRPEIKFQAGDILDLKLTKNDFDLALLIAVLHHLPAAKLRLKVLKDIRERLKKGGRLVVSTWNLWQAKNFRKYFFSGCNWRQKIKYGVWSLKDFFAPWKASGACQPRYVHCFTKRELRRLLTQAGFEIEEIYYEGSGRRAGLLRGRNLIAVGKK